MPLEKSQIEQIKKQLIQQIESTFPDEKKSSAISQIQAMNEKELEEFLIQNNLIQEGKQEQKCIFCSIIYGDIPSYKIDENKDAIAILEINPISEGHVIIIPKKHIETREQLPKSSLILAKKIAKKISTKLKPKDVLIEPANLLGHEIINILPVYTDETLQSEKTKAPKEKLLELQKKLQKIQRTKTIKKNTLKKIKAEKLWLPKRIP